MDDDYFEEKFLDVRVFDDLSKELIGFIHIDLSPLM